MKAEFKELPGWTFQVTEVSNGVFKGNGIHLDGRSVAATDFTAESVLEKCKEYAANLS